jgi:hypothetical protein
VVVATKKKQLWVYTWAGGLSASGPLVARGAPISLAEVPICMCCVGDSVVVGYKKAYMRVHLTNGSHTKVLDTDRLGICLPIPSTSTRPSRLLLSNGNRGVFVDMQTWTISDESISWTAPPIQASVSTPFILACTERTMEVHDLALLHAVQNVPLVASEDSRSLAASSLQPPPALADHIYLSGRDSLTLLRIDTLDLQVDSLVKANRYLDALSICSLCPEQVAAGGIQLSSIHEKFASNLLVMGDFDAAINHFLQARTPPFKVLSLFPTFFPNKLPLPPSAKGVRPTYTGKGSPFASPKAAERAAASMVRYLESHRNSSMEAAEEVDRKRKRHSVAYVDMSGNNGGGGGGGIIGDLSSNVSASSHKMTYSRNLINGTEEEEDEEAIATAVMIDTVLLVSRLQCSPPRKWDIIDLLKRPNRCHEASCLPLLAERGVPYAEALLYLYRSVGAHERVLANLVEDRCIGTKDGAWSKEQFINWKADYLRYLWLSTNASETKLVLTSHQGDAPLVSLLKANPLLGLKVLAPNHDITRRADENPIGGIGFTIKVVAMELRQVELPKTASPGDAIVPLTAVNGLAMAYLEALVASEKCPPEGHDELGLLLIETACDPSGTFCKMNFMCLHREMSLSLFKII